MFSNKGSADDAAPPPPARTADEVLAKVMELLAAELDAPRDTLTPDAMLTDLGLDSINAESVSAEIEEWIGFPVHAPLLWQYPTPRQLADHLAEMSQPDE